MRVDDQGQLHMNWENGGSLALVPGEDDFHVLSEKQDNKSEKKDPTDSYIEYLNSNILNRIDYGYTATIPNDIYVLPETFPPAIREIVSTFRNYEAELLDKEEMWEGEDLER